MRNENLHRIQSKRKAFIASLNSGGARIFLVGANVGSRTYIQNFIITKKTYIISSGNSYHFKAPAG